MLARVLFAFVVLADIAGATISFSAGVWPLGVLCVLLAVWAGVLLARTWTGPRKAPEPGGYVEHQREMY